MASIVTPVGLATFLHLKEPRPVVEGGEPRYSLNLIFDEAAQKSSAFKMLQQAVQDCIAAKWPTKRPTKLTLPFKDAGEKEYEGYEGGHVYVNPWSKTAVGCVDKSRTEIVDLSDVWSGWTARAFVKPFAYDTGQNKGVSLLLDCVQFVAAGPRLDGRRDAASFPDDLPEDEPL